jgi:hypothetical protein
MGCSILGDECFAKRHIPSALSKNGSTFLASFTQAIEEVERVGQCPGVQLRVAAGKIDSIGIGVRRFVRERREENAFCSRCSPAP